MFEVQDISRDCRGSEVYEIRLQGHLQNRWTEWFDCMTLTREEDGTTTLYGRLPDQTALHGILLKIRNMNIKLISVRQVERDFENKSKTSKKGEIT